MSQLNPPLNGQRELEPLLRARPLRWLVTGAAGFIGSHLIETLLKLDQQVVALDNFATGHMENLHQVRAAVGEAAWDHLRFIEGDIVDLAVCRGVCREVDVVLHQAALGSVPRSIDDPLASHAANATGFVNLLLAARDAGVKQFVYAASSAAYGDHPGLPKVEDQIGAPLSPYAATKVLNELYAGVFGRCYGMNTLGLRYFNVFGPRQDPEGPYAAVIPRWVDAMLRGERCVIYGDGENSRDFCFVANAVQANLRAALATDAAAINQIYNVAVGARTTLNELHKLLADALRARRPGLVIAPPEYRAPRAGDVLHSQADISKARRLLGYQPTHDIAAGVLGAIDWYIGRATRQGLAAAPLAEGRPAPSAAPDLATA